MPRERFDPTDTLPLVEAKLDTNARKNEALQAAVGINDDSTTFWPVQGYPDDSTSNSQDGDSAKVRMDKHEARIFWNRTRITILEQGGTTGGSGTTRAEILLDDDLGLNYSLTAAIRAERGTTVIEAGDPVEAQYPLGAGTYHVETRFTAGVASTSVSAGSVVWLDVSIDDSGRNRRFLAIRTAGVIGEWAEVTNWQWAGDGPEMYSKLLPADFAISNLQNSGEYVVVVDSNSAASDEYPTKPPSGVRFWSLTVRLVDPTLGFVTARSSYDDPAGNRKPDEYICAIGKANAGVATWNILPWTRITDQESVDLGADWDMTTVTQSGEYFTVQPIGGTNASQYPRESTLAPIAWGIKIQITSQTTGFLEATGFYEDAAGNRRPHVFKRNIAKLNANNADWLLFPWANLTEENALQLAGNFDLPSIAGEGSYQTTVDFNAANAAQYPTTGTSGTRTWLLEGTQMAADVMILRATAVYQDANGDTVPNTFQRLMTKTNPSDATWVTFPWKALTDA